MVPPLKRRFGSQIFFLFSVFSFLFSLCYAESPKTIRVAVIQDAASIRLKVRGFYEAIDSASHRVLSRDKNLNTTVTIYKDGILVGDIKSRTNNLFIKSDDPGAIVIVDGRQFRGNIQLIKKDDAHLLVVNYINLEDYIKGILYHEASHYWPEEALKTQAIVVRTYAAYQMQKNASRDYDVTSDIYSQVYGGRTSERYRTNQAVDKTKDNILTYKGNIFPTYYHATCAGKTEDASMLWNIDIAPLKGVSCGFCKNSPHFNWYYVLSKDEAKFSLIKSGYKIKDIQDIVILGTDRSGRITTLRIITDKQNLDIPAKDFRNIIGPNIIRSTNFKIDLVNHDIVFEGLGWGHGVGLCQWGAYFMAKQGYTAEQILKYYYPGSELSTISK